MQKKDQLIVIKGTKEGLIFSINESGSFEIICEQLQDMLLSAPYHDTNEKASVIVKLGYRYLTKEQKQTIKKAIEKDGRFLVEKFDSEVLDKSEIERLIDRLEVKSYFRVIRSGQVLQVVGDLLLIGDVNPGGEVRATGNIYILGKLNGIAHAGIDGDDESLIIASFMNPQQLRIAQYISRSPDYESDGVYMEYGYYNEEENKIEINRLQDLLPKIENRRNEERGR